MILDWTSESDQYVIVDIYACVAVCSLFHMCMCDKYAFLSLRTWKLTMVLWCHYIAICGQLACSILKVNCILVYIYCRNGSFYAIQSQCK
jgi:hypothetical protein